MPVKYLIAFHKLKYFRWFYEKVLKEKTVLLTPVFRAEINKSTIFSCGRFTFKNSAKSSIVISVEFGFTTTSIIMCLEEFLCFKKMNLGLWWFLVLRIFDRKCCFLPLCKKCPEKSSFRLVLSQIMFGKLLKMILFSLL